MNDVIDCFLVHSVFPRKLVLRYATTGIAGADVGYRAVREGVGATVFNYHVAKVLTASASKQVMWIATEAVITSMANVHSWGYWAVSQFVRYAMGIPFASPSTTLAK